MTNAMNSHRHVFVTAFAVVVGLLLLFALYMGTYYAMLKGRISSASPPAPGIPIELMLEPVYRSDSPLVENALEPAHRLDRVIRPGCWP